MPLIGRRKQPEPDPEKQDLERKLEETTRSRDARERRLRRLEIQVNVMQRRHHAEG